MINEETKAKALGRLRRIEGQVQGLQRMIEHEAYCVDILLQTSAVRGALEQVEKLLLGRHIESCVADALRSGSGSERQRSLAEAGRTYVEQHHDWDEIASSMVSVLAEAATQAG